MNTQTVLKHYLICALWSSSGEDGEPLDGTFGPEDLAPCALAQAEQDVAAFLADCEELNLDLSQLGEEQVGHDFWLTRNGHGAGFWDRGLGQLGKALSEAAKSYGSCDIYEGDDGLLYMT